MQLIIHKDIYALQKVLGDLPEVFQNFVLIPEPNYQLKFAYKTLSKKHNLPYLELFPMNIWGNPINNGKREIVTGNLLDWLYLQMLEKIT